MVVIYIKLLLVIWIKEPAQQLSFNFNQLFSSSSQYFDILYLNDLNELCILILTILSQARFIDLNHWQHTGRKYSLSTTPLSLTPILYIYPHLPIPAFLKCSSAPSLSPSSAFLKSRERQVLSWLWNLRDKMWSKETKKRRLEDCCWIVDRLLRDCWRCQIYC